MKVLNKIALALSLGALVVGCDQPPADPTTPMGSTLSGVIMAGPVSGANVELQDEFGTVIGSGFTSSTGAFMITLDSPCLGTCFVVSKGGSYTDEATNSLVILGANEGLELALDASEVTGEVAVTPISTIISQSYRLQGGTQSIAQVRTQFETAFGFAVDHTVIPVEATNAAATATATQAQMQASLRTAAFSQLAQDLLADPTQQIALLNALGQDLVDGVLDGLDNGTPINVGVATLPVDTKAKVATAILNFFNNPNNQLTLTTAQIGTLPFATTAVSANYVFTFANVSTAPAAGKHNFQITLQNAAGANVTGSAPALKPILYTSNMVRSAPSFGCGENGGGVYTCDVYYPMASRTGNTQNGIWELQLTVAGETVSFFPDVVSSNTVGILQGQATGVDADTLVLGASTVQREYQIYDEFDPGANTLMLYISALDRLTLVPGQDYPGVGAGTIFAGTSSTVTNVTTTLAEYSLDGITYNPMTEIGSGSYSVTGLTTGPQTIWVRFSVNGVVKTTDGQAPVAGVNDFITLDVNIP